MGKQVTEMPTGTLDISKFTAKVIGDKRQWRQYEARTRKLAEDYHTAIAALERYMQFFGPGQADSVLAMLEDLADLFELSAANRTPIREVVGEDSVELAAAVLRKCSEGQWISRERERLTNAIDRAAGEDTRWTHDEEQHFLDQFEVDRHGAG